MKIILDKSADMLLIPPSHSNSPPTHTHTHREEVGVGTCFSPFIVWYVPQVAIRYQVGVLLLLGNLQPKDKQASSSHVMWRRVAEVLRKPMQPRVGIANNKLSDWISRSWGRFKWSLEYSALSQI